MPMPVRKEYKTRVYCERGHRMKKVRNAWSQRRHCWYRGHALATKNLFQTIEAQLWLTPSESLIWNLQGMYGPSTGTQSGSNRALANTTVAWKALTVGHRVNYYASKGYEAPALKASR